MMGPMISQDLSQNLSHGRGSQQPENSITPDNVIYRGHSFDIPEGADLLFSPCDTSYHCKDGVDGEGEDGLERQTSREDKVYHTGEIPQRTLIEVNQDFWDTLSTLIDSRLELHFHERESKRKIPTKSKAKKPKSFWNRALNLCEQIIEEHGYLWAGNFREDRYLAIQFPHPQDYSRILSRLQDRNPELIEFRIMQEGNLTKKMPWRFVCYKGDEERMKKKAQGAAYKPKHKKGLF